MNSTYLGYALFILALFVLIGLNGNAAAVEQLQNQIVPHAYARYVHLPGFFFVLTGVFSSILIGFNFREVGKAHRALFFVFARNRVNFQHYIDRMKELATFASTRGVESLEEYAAAITYPFLSEGLLLLVNGYKKEQLVDILHTRIENEANREDGDRDLFAAAGRYAPGYGMLGTTVGLIQMFSADLTNAGDFRPILAGLSVAFTTTLYGLLLSNFFFQPMADKIRRRNEEEILLKAMIVEGLVMILEKKHVIQIQDQLQSFVPQARKLTVTQLAAVETAAGRKA